MARAPSFVLGAIARIARALRRRGRRMSEGTLSLVVRRTIRASAERLFALWTSREHLERWWGPPGVVCTSAEIDLRVGGRYRIANRLPDGRTLSIVGEF